MAAGRDEAQRQLALDVRTCIFAEKRFETFQFVHRGYIAEYKQQPLPETPLIAAAREQLKREREALHAKQMGNG